MEHQLIGKWVRFEHYRWGGRYWLVNGRHHRVGGPAYENIKDGYCQWYEHGRFVRDNHGASADWSSC